MAPARALSPSARESNGNAAPRWLTALSIAIFVLYAANFLYFFVDDEAIPYVFAQNLLRGRGLSYNVLEGRVEGYSDFLHVCLSAVTLAVVQGAGLPKYSVFFIGKSISLIAGVALVFMVSMIIRRCPLRREGAVAALTIVVLSGPVAVWSCSSLEAAPFALAFTVLVWALVSGQDLAAAAAAAVVVLERIDGFVYAAAIVAAFIVVSSDERRHAIWRRVAVPLVVLLVAYHAWRVLYFGELIPTPVRAKILYKFTFGTSHLVVKAPTTPYWIRFIGVYGWPIAALLAIAVGHAIRIGRTPRALALASVLLFMYAALVGDWMFGFRFFVPLMPLLALTVCFSLSAFGDRLPRVAMGIAIACVVWTGFTASRFIQTYRAAEHVDSFLHHPSRDLHLFFFPYYGLYEAARQVIPPEEIVADNQAGFVPFMLGVTNIDDLGICSPFYARMPTTDVFFTEVGRYLPLTDKQPLRAGQAYLLYRNAQFIMSRTDLLASANHSHIPRSLMGGYFELLNTDREGENAIYRRTALPANRYATDPAAFMENLAHVSYLRRAAISGVRIDPTHYVRELPFLHDGLGEISLNGIATLDLVFSDHDEDIREIDIDAVRVSVPATLQINLLSSDDRLVHRQTIAFAANEGHGVWMEIPAGTRAHRFILNVTADASGSIWIDDLRVQGQSRALKEYIARTLRFSPTAPR